METQHNPVVISKDSRNQQLSSKLSYPVNYLHSLEEVKVSLHNSVWSAERELASTVCELRTSRCSSWIYKRQRNQRSNCQHCWITKKAREFQKNIYFFFIDYTKAFDCVDHYKLWKILKEMGIPDHLTYLPACNTGDPGLIHGSGRSPGEGNGNPLQYSCLENPMEGGAW